MYARFESNFMLHSYPMLHTSLFKGSLVRSFYYRADVEYSVQLSSFKNKRGNHRRAAAAAAPGGEEAQPTASTTLVVDMAEWNGSVVTIETRPGAARRRLNDLSGPPEEERRERDSANGATSLRLCDNTK